MSTKHSPIRVICAFCGWSQVVRLRRAGDELPKCEQCGCDDMISKRVGAIEELFSNVKCFVMR